MLQKKKLSIEIVISTFIFECDNWPPKKNNEKKSFNDFDLIWLYRL